MLHLRNAVLSLACLAVIAAPHYSAAQSSSATSTPHFPTNEDLRHLRSLSTPLLSPDGKQILFAVTNSTADEAATHLWIVPAPSNGDQKPRQLTFSPPSDKRGEHNPQWAPDNSAIFFLAKRGDHTQLFRLDLRGGEASPYDLKIMPPVDVSKDKDAINPPPPPTSNTKKDEKRPEETKVEPLPIDVAGYAISSDGKYLALWAHDPETPGEKKQKDAKIDASWVNHERHFTRLYIAALKPDGSVDGDLKPAAVPPDIHGVLWSPVDSRLLAVSEAPNGAADLGPAAQAFVLEAATPDKPQKLSAIPSSVSRAEWSHDANTIVFLAQTTQDAPPGYEELFALPKESSSQKVIPLSSRFDGQFGPSPLISTPDGSLIAQAGIGTHASAVRIKIDGSESPQVIDLGTSMVLALNTNPRQTGWVWLSDAGGKSTHLCYAAKLGDSCTAVQTPDLAPASLRSVEPKLVQWKSGAFTIEGLLFLPPDAGSARVPLIVDVHGGPFGAWFNQYSPFHDFLIGHGWAVLLPNPRGSSNYGVKFAAANKNDLGGGDYQDVMAGVDYVLAHYPIDPARMALMGYSYGGEMAGFVEGKIDRFKAIISGAPVIDQFSEYGTEDESWYDRWYFGKPWEHMNDAWRQSPLAGAAHAKTPFLLLQGESDTTDPVGQAQEMYRALRQAGVPVELVTYPRENHGPLATGMFGRPSPEPWHGFDARQHIIKFIEDAFSPAH
ncbi:prolyl oligopeptidase family serine peptidase [Occallatibacter savannae]|uniref:S9 family peptidase n=1 Tax=Occallatibacter savannae TaxID=1002691 RepID=UPI000D6928FB|nr:prolyl oligopeptidase family serine peptidase [Occallatibacter savannae]